MKEINELLAVKQRAKPSHGVEQFSYYTTNNCDHKVSHATGICDKPYNVASPKDSIVLTNVDNEKLKFVNTGILLDTGDLFDDLLDEETAKKLGLQYNEVPDRLKSADGQKVELLGRSKTNIFIMFPPLKICFVTKPVVVRRLFTPMMLSTKFLRRYNVSVDAKDNHMHIGIKKNDRKRERVQLHSNKITGILKVLNYMDERRKANMKKGLDTDFRCQDSTEETKDEWKKELKYKEADLRDIAVSEEEVGALRIASNRDNYKAYSKSKTKLGEDKFACPPSALTCGVCRRLVKEAVRMDCCRRIGCSDCVSKYWKANKRCWNYDCKGGEGPNWKPNEEVRKRVSEMEKGRNEEEKGSYKNSMYNTRFG